MKQLYAEQVRMYDEELHEKQKTIDGVRRTRHDIKNHRNKLSSIRKRAENQTDYKQQIEDTQKAITETYKIPVEHFLIVNGENGLYAAILVALTDDNVDIIEKEMESQGFFRAQPTDNQILEDRKNRKWIDIRFEPTEPDDIML